MRLHRFYIAPEFFAPKAGVIGQEIKIEAKAGKAGAVEKNEQKEQDFERLIHQWRDIFRFGKGDRVLIFNELYGQWLLEFTGLDKKNGATLEIIEQDIAPSGIKGEVMMPKQNITLYMSIIKNSNFDLVVEKATELGVSKIVPVKTERTVKSGLNFERLRKLAIEASEQCGRMNIPEIAEIMELEDAIQDAKEVTKKAQKTKNAVEYAGEYGSNNTSDQNRQNAIFFAHIDESLENDKDIMVSAKSALDNSTQCDKAIFIGPEGGWSDIEIELFKHENISPISLGQFVLRAETAAIVGVSKFM